MFARQRSELVEYSSDRLAHVLVAGSVDADAVDRLLNLLDVSGGCLGQDVDAVSKSEDRRGQDLALLFDLFVLVLLNPEFLIHLVELGGDFLLVVLHALGFVE